MEKNVKFSVVTICYNVKDELKRTLRSLWAQTYGSTGDCGGGDDGGKFAGDCIGNGKFAFGNSLAGDCGGYESIVVDGGSSDGTAAFLRREKRIARYVSEPDRGVYDAMNKGLRLCRGDFVIFMNAGDEFFNPRVLERAAAVLRAHPDCRFLFGDACLVGEDGHCRFREYDAPVTTQNICHQSIFYDRRLFAECMTRGTGLSPIMILICGRLPGTAWCRTISAIRSAVFMRAGCLPGGNMRKNNGLMLLCCAGNGANGRN